MCVYEQTCECVPSSVQTSAVWKPEEGFGSSEAGMRGSCEPLCVGWEQNLGPLQEPGVLLTTVTSLQFFHPAVIVVQITSLFIVSLRSHCFMYF